MTNGDKCMRLLTSCLLFHGFAARFFRVLLNHFIVMNLLFSFSICACFILWVQLICAPLPVPLCVAAQLAWWLAFVVGGHALQVVPCMNWAPLAAWAYHACATREPCFNIFVFKCLCLLLDNKCSERLYYHKVVVFLIWWAHWMLVFLVLLALSPLSVVCRSLLFYI